jgi:hypothetical protein
VKPRDFERRGLGKSEMMKMMKELMEDEVFGAIIEGKD